MATDRITSVAMRNPGASDRVTRVRMRTSAIQNHDRITRVRMRNAAPVAPFAVSIGNPVFNSTPFEEEAFSAFATQTPDYYLWEVIAGYASIADPTVQTARVTAFARPATFTITLKVTAFKAGLTPVTATLSYTVAPHAGYFRKDGTGVFIH